MHLELGHRRFDTARGLVVIGLADTADDAAHLVDDGADAVAVTREADAARLRERVEVPVVVASASAGSVTADDGAVIEVRGPFHDLPAGERLGAFAATILRGAPVVLTTEVRAVRRVGAVAARILGAGADR